MLAQSLGIEILNKVSMYWILIALASYIIFAIRLKLDAVAIPYTLVAFMAIVGLLPLCVIKLICWLFNIEGYWFLG